MKTLLVVAMLCVVSAGAAADELQDLSAEARGLVKEFSGVLKGRLMDGMKAGGPPTAIDVCNREALSIAEGIGGTSGWSVGRTALRVRNAENRADGWEQQVLEQFLQRQAAGEPLAKMEFAEVVEEDGLRTFRYMKAIPTGAACLACHGSELAPEVKAKLEALYPGDQATGFREGDLRGSFTLSRPL